jgi:MinD superfamily P-loop ATPase
MKQLVVISGKGGTGKTSLVASFASLAERVVLADCDVDAADLHLVVQASLVSRNDFRGGTCALIDDDHCSFCGICEDLCRFDAISSDSSTFSVDPVACEGCGVCAWFCTEGAIDLVKTIDGEWYLSETRLGPMVHARLKAAGENSGKLVNLLRAEARTVAENRDIDLVIIDGSPGIGCPVIASITGVDLALVITEPTLSGLHDLERVVRLTDHFGIPAKVVINRYDININMTRRIEQSVRRLGAELLGRVRYDPAVTQAQIEGLSVIEHSSDGAAADIAAVWRDLHKSLFEHERLALEA